MSTLPQFPINYLGTNSKNPANVLYGTTVPNVNDTHHALGTLYLNTVTRNVYMLTSIAGGAATWTQISGGGGPSLPPISKFVVAQDGSTPYTTIQSAINAAVTAGSNATVYIRPGTYTENLTLTSTVNLVGATYSVPFGGEVTINGSHTISANTVLGFSNIQIEVTAAASSAFNMAAAAALHLLFSSCTFNITDGFIVSAPSASGNVIFDACLDLSAANNGIVSNNAGSIGVIAVASALGRGSAHTLSLNNGNSVIFNTQIGCSISKIGSGQIGLNSSTLGSQITISGSTTVNIFNSQVNSPTTGLTIAGTAQLNISNSTISSQSGAALLQNSSSTLNIHNCDISPAGVGFSIDGVGVGTISLIGCSIHGSNVPNPALTYESTSQFEVASVSFWNAVKILSGAVDPSAGAGVPAAQGSLFLRTNGGAATTLYVKEGAADTAWAPK